MASLGKSGYYSMSSIALVFFLIYFRNCFVIAEKLTIWIDPPDNYGTTTATYNVTASEDSWWTAAQSRCSQFGGHLYIPRSQSFPNVLLTQMELGVDYWVGAVKYPTWIWTGDQSSLYSHIGYMRIFTYWPMYHLEGNCVLTCHQHCKEHYTIRVIGLRGNECYCVSNAWFAEHTDYSQVRCPGNYGEFCGDDYGVSLYKLENFITVPSPSDKCGFITKSAGVSPSYHCHQGYTAYDVTVYLENNCDVRKHTACEDSRLRNYFGWTCSRNICVSEQQLDTFQNSKRKCNLVKVTRSDINDLCSAMLESNFWITSTYWVGLQRRFEQKWINGSEMVLPAMDYYSDVLPLCLAVSRTYLGVRFHWTKCTHRHMSICETLKVRSTNPPAGMWTDTTYTTSGTSTHTTDIPSPPSCGPSSSPDIGYHSSTQAKSTQHTERIATSSQQPTSNIGTSIYVGCSIAAMVIAASLVVLIISYRKRLLCFKDESYVPSRGHVHFNAGVDNATYSGDVASSNSSLHYSVIPIATVTPYNHVHLTSSRQEAEIHRDYYNIKPEKNTLGVTGPGPQETIDDGHYVVPRASLSKVTDKDSMSTAHIHNTGHYAVPHSRSVDDVDGTRDDDDVGIYHLAGDVQKKGDNPPGAIYEQSRDTTDLKAPYITLIEDIPPLHTHAGTGVYDQVSHPSQRHDYDRISGQRHVKDGDMSYDHVGQVDYDADDNYDTTRRRQQRRRLDDYSHTDDLNVVFEEDDDDDEGDDTYQSINDMGEEEEGEATHGNVQPVYSTTGSSLPQVADDAEYYNLPLVTNAGDDISENQSKQHGDQVYSLATSASDA